PRLRDYPQRAQKQCGCAEGACAQGGSHHRKCFSANEDSIPGANASSFVSSHWKLALCQEWAEIPPFQENKRLFHFAKKGRPRSCHPPCRGLNHRFHGV